MIVSVFALLAWAAVCMFALLPKSLGLVENAILYILVFASFAISGSILSVNLGYIEIGERPGLVFCFLTDRMVTNPIIQLAGINLFLRIRNKWLKALAPVVTVAVAFGLHMLSIRAAVVTPTGWVPIHFVVLVSLIFLLGSCFAKLLRRMA